MKSTIPFTFVKSFNDGMVKILELSPPNYLYTALFDMLMTHRRTTLFNKHIGLTLKCLLKIINTAELNILMRISSMAVLGKVGSIWLLFGGDVTLDGAAVIKYFLNLFL